MGQLGGPGARHGPAKHKACASSSRQRHTCCLIMINDQQLRTEFFVSLGCHTHVTQERPAAVQEAQGDADMHHPCSPRVDPYAPYHKTIGATAAL